MDTAVTIVDSSNLLLINDWTIYRLSKSASKKLPSRGMVMVDAKIGERTSKIALEPDGKGSHWFRFSNELQELTSLHAGDLLRIEMQTTKSWPEPAVPSDLKTALSNESLAMTSWHGITPMARWDWIRWISGTKKQSTRARRVEVTISKLSSGKRRPCCFNRSDCTQPDVSRNGVLLYHYDKEVSL